MNKNFKLKKSIRLVTATLAGSMTMAGAVSAEENIFSIQELPTGYMVADSHMEGKCGEGKCGEGKNSEGKCGEGKCGEGKSSEGKCGEGKCGEGKCGEGKCGESN